MSLTKQRSHPVWRSLPPCVSWVRSPFLTLELSPSSTLARIPKGPSARHLPHCHHDWPGSPPAPAICVTAVSETLGRFPVSLWALPELPAQQTRACFTSLLRTWAALSQPVRSCPDSPAALEGIYEPGLSPSAHSLTPLAKDSGSRKSTRPPTMW